MEIAPGTNTSKGQNSSVPGDLPFSIEDYHDDLRELQLSDEQARELLETLWGIMRIFVECGFNVDVSGRAMMEIFNHAVRGAPKDEA